MMIKKWATEELAPGCQLQKRAPGYQLLALGVREVVPR